MIFFFDVRPCALSSTVSQRLGSFINILYPCAFFCSSWAFYLCLGESGGSLSLEGSPVYSRPSPAELLHCTKSCNGAVKWLIANVWILLSVGVTTGRVCYPYGHPV